MSSTCAPYGTWKSPIDLQTLFERPSPPLYPRYYHGAFYWLEARSKEAGRHVLLRRDSDGVEHCLTPRSFNIRTRAHEYGGQCFAFAGEDVYFSNFEDQRIYVQSLTSGAPPRPITPSHYADGARGLYADFVVSDDASHLVFVFEKEYDDRENVNTIAAIALSELGPETTDVEPVILAAGADFYANPVVAENPRRLAWMQWDHPNMPWDSAEAVVAEFHGLALGVPTVVAGGDGRAVCQLSYAPDGLLYFAMDGDDGSDVTGFWNLHAYDSAGVRRITSDAAEYGAAHWIFGERRAVWCGPSRVAAVRTVAARDELVDVDVHTGTATARCEGYTQFARLAPGAHPGTVLAIVASPTQTPALVQIGERDDPPRVLWQDETLLDQKDMSLAEAICYPTRDGQHAHAFFYAPENSAYTAPPESKPPLMVMVHGGPTSRSSAVLALDRQFWTTCGFAVLDVNHRGSTGYGRAYRQALRGQWGNLDVDDVADGVRFLIREGRVDGSRICIRGKSAGGYAVLRALTCYPELFAAGASYYGIGNLVTLTETTHKFEAHYLDGLLGEAYATGVARAPTSAYYQRSPVHFLDALRSPMILFQGLDDRVVPPAVSREVVEALQTRQIPHEYVEYPDEGHGFRRSVNRIDALRRESAFYARVLGLGDDT